MGPSLCFTADTVPTSVWLCASEGNPPASWEALCAATKHANNAIHRSSRQIRVVMGAAPDGKVQRYVVYP